MNSKDETFKTFVLIQPKNSALDCLYVSYLDETVTENSVCELYRQSQERTPIDNSVIAGSSYLALFPCSLQVSELRSTVHFKMSKVNTLYSKHEKL